MSKGQRLTEHDALASQFVEAGISSLAEQPREVLLPGFAAKMSSTVRARHRRRSSDYVDALVSRLTESAWPTAEAVGDSVRLSRRTHAEAVNPAVVTLAADTFDFVLDSRRDGARRRDC